MGINHFISAAGMRSWAMWIFKMSHGDHLVPETGVKNAWREIHFILWDRSEKNSIRHRIWEYLYYTSNISLIFLPPGVTVVELYCLTLMYRWARVTKAESTSVNRSCWLPFRIGEQGSWRGGRSPPHLMRFTSKQTRRVHLFSHRWHPLFAEHLLFWYRLTISAIRLRTEIPDTAFWKKRRRIRSVGIWLTWRCLHGNAPFWPSVIGRFFRLADVPLFVNRILHGGTLLWWQRAEQKQKG